MEISIYLFRCPLTNRVMYVGQTRNTGRRIAQHFKTRSPFSDWLWSEVNAGRRPVFEVVVRAGTQEEADASERSLIRDLVSAGEPLFNVQHTSEAMVKVGGTLKPESKMTLDDYREVALRYESHARHHMKMADGYAERALARFGSA
jgi:hypothetical protein